MHKFLKTHLLRKIYAPVRKSHSMFGGTGERQAVTKIYFNRRDFENNVGILVFFIKE